MKSTFARLTATGAALALLGTIGLSAPAQARTAAPSCRGWSHGNYDHGWDTVKHPSNMKNGPFSACGNVMYLKELTTVYFHCMVINDYGKIWVYVRVAGTKKHGWVSYDNLEHWSADLIQHCT
ncbi:hypothetical protein ACIBH1_38930 [Nonomuraea sp. NPDC050663]|uniref:hypothetical protein n=1 Tax=Nonomuraea sp. NPDC050663 TaxID=3364370 RepID=UPI00378C607B